MDDTRYELLSKKIDRIIEMMELFDSRMIFIEKNYNIAMNTRIRDIIIDEYKLERVFLMECLEKGNILADIDVIKKIFFTNIDINNYPIRCAGNKKVIEYWLNDKWNNDDIYLFNTLTSIIKSSYLSINIYKNYENDIEKFVKNQEYIVKVSSDQKYKESFMKSLIAFLIKV